MKKLMFILMVLPLTVFASEKAAKKPMLSFKKQCERISDPEQRKKNCLLDEKQKEAANNFRNFQDNNHIEQTF